MRDDVPDFAEMFNELRQSLLGMLTQLRTQTDIMPVLFLPTQEARGQAFRALRPRFNQQPTPGYFSADTRAIVLVRLVFDFWHGLKPKAIPERLDRDYFSMN